MGLVDRHQSQLRPTPRCAKRRVSPIVSRVDVAHAFPQLCCLFPRQCLLCAGVLRTLFTSHQKFRSARYSQNSTRHTAGRAAFWVTAVRLVVLSVAAHSSEVRLFPLRNQSSQHGAFAWETPVAPARQKPPFECDVPPRRSGSPRALQPPDCRRLSIPPPSPSPSLHLRLTRTHVRKRTTALRWLDASPSASCFLQHSPHRRPTPHICGSGSCSGMLRGPPPAALGWRSSQRNAGSSTAWLATACRGA